MQSDVSPGRSRAAARNEQRAAQPPAEAPWRFGSRPFADLLASLRIARGLSQERLAEVSGVSVRAIGDLERGVTRRPQRQTVEALARGLGLDAAGREGLMRATRTAGGQPVPRREAGDDPASLVGRERELAGLVELLECPAVRMVSVLGPAGIGKTALALAAMRLIRTAADTATVVSLDCLDPADPVTAIAARTIDRRLVLLDGFDPDRISGAALADLLARRTQLRLLVTARSPVRVRAEHRWPIGPLGLPPEASGPRHTPTAQTVGRAPAVRLLVARARAVRAGFTLTDAETLVAGSVVRRLSGNPLAIELVATWLRTRSLSDVDGILAVALADAGDDVLHRVVRCTVDLLPDRDVERLALLAALGRATPQTLRQAVMARHACPDHVDATVALLAALRLVTVSGSDGEITVPPAVREAVLAQPRPRARRTGRRPVTVGEVMPPWGSPSD